MGRPILWSEWSSRAPSLFAVLTSTDLLIQYYKILNLGVPLEAVQQRMYMEGYDPQALNVDLFNKVQRKMRQEDFDYEEGKDVDAQYNKYFDLLSEGVIMKEVKRMMMADGYDPSILDQYQYRRLRNT
mmetsp:Transcript_16953/g.39140  ORF Transcript_16953/g.39140 Transcript_16953/m.39140 type:complete len:128 (+) Transcript_16953:155-538(+)